MPAPSALYILDAHTYPKIYGPDEQRDIAALVRLAGPLQTKASVTENRRMLQNVELIFSGWGAPRMDGAFLAGEPQHWEVSRERARTLA